MRNFGGFAKAFEAAIDQTLGIDGAQAEAVLGIIEDSVTLFWQKTLS